MTDAPERIWAWDDKTPTDRDKAWAACDAGTGSTAYVRADLAAAMEAENQRLRNEVSDLRSYAECVRGKAREILGYAPTSTEGSHG